MPRYLRKGSILILDGFNISVPAEYLKDAESPNSQNMYVNRGILTKRNGTTNFPPAGTLISGTEKEIMAGREFEREDTKYNVRIGLDRIEKYNTGTNVWDNITGTDLTGGTSDLIDTAIPMLSGKRILCFTNGVDAIRKYTGTGNTAVLGGTPPVAKYIQEYKTYLVCANIAGGTDISQRVQWSDTALPETWTGGNSGTLDLVEDGDAISGLSIFGSFVCVHKLNAIYLGSLVSNSDIFRFDRINTKSGTVANGSITNLPTGEQIFLAADGLRVFNGVTAPPIESPVNDEIRDSLATDYSHKTWGVLVKEKDEVWIGIPIGDQTTGDTVYKFNYKSRNLYKDVRSNITAAWRATNIAATTWDDTVGTWDAQTERWNSGSQQDNFPFIMLGDNTGCTVKVDNGVNNDVDTVINAFWESKDFQHDQQVMSRWKELRMWASGNTVKVDYSTDAGETWTEIGQSPVSLDSSFPPDSDPDILYFDVVSTQIRFRFTNTVSAETFALKQFAIGYTPREQR